MEFASFEKHSDTQIEIPENIDFSISNLKTLIDFVCAKYKNHLESHCFNEEILTRILFDFGYLNLAKVDSKSAIHIAKFIENVTRFVNLVTVNNKFRLLIQLFYNFENKSELKDDIFFEELETLVPQMEFSGVQTLDENIADIKYMIGSLNRTRKNPEYIFIVSNFSNLFKKKGPFEFYLSRIESY